MSDKYSEIAEKVLWLVNDFRKKSANWENPTKIYVGNEELRALLECANFYRVEHMDGPDVKTFMGMRVYHVHEQSHLAVA